MLNLLCLAVAWRLMASEKFYFQEDKHMLYNMYY